MKPIPVTPIHGLCICVALALGHVGGANAGSVSTYQCSPDCNVVFQLKKLGTHEFRSQCWNASESQWDAPPLNKDAKCSPDDKGVTCTITVILRGADYSSCSCTNWNSAQKKNARLKVRCSQ